MRRMSRAWSCSGVGARTGWNPRVISSKSVINWNISTAPSPRPALGPTKCLMRNRAGHGVLTLKTPYRDGTTHIVLEPVEFVQRLVALALLDPTAKAKPYCSRLEVLDHTPEREINAALDNRRGLRHLMKPEALSLTCHNEPMPFLEIKCDCFLCPPVPELKPPRSTE